MLQEELGSEVSEDQYTLLLFYTPTPWSCVRLERYLAWPSNKKKSVSALQEELGFDASEAELDDAFVCTLPTQVVRFVDRNVLHHNAGIAQFVAVHTLSQCTLCRSAHFVAMHT